MTEQGKLRLVFRIEVFVEHFHTSGGVVFGRDAISVAPLQN
ncbi:hypothetical protein ABQF26_33160 [Mycolicibacterium elephantis]